MKRSGTIGIKIQLLGQPCIIDETGEQQTVRGHQAWALLTRILLSKRLLDRRTIAGELFPEADDPLGSLRWCLAALRRALTSAEALVGDPIEVNLPSGTKVDVISLQNGEVDIETTGGLLETIDPRCSPEFATWLLVERERLGSMINDQIRQQTLQAVSASDYERAIRLAEFGVRRSPFDEAAHILLVKSMALAGKDVAAQAHATATVQSFINELGVPPTDALQAATRHLVSSPFAGISKASIINSLIQSGVAALSGGAIDTGIEQLRQAVGEAQNCEDQLLLSKALFELGTALVHSIRGYDDEGAILLGRAVALSDELGVDELATAGLREIGYLEALAGRRPSAAKYLDQALRRTNEAEGRAGIHGVIGFNLVDWGKTDEALDHFEMSLELARNSGNRRHQIWALGTGSLGHLNNGNFEQSVLWLSECIKLVDELRWVSFRPWPVAILGETRLRMGEDPQLLHADLEEAFALSCQLNDPCWEAQVARVLALSYLAGNDYERALEWFDEAGKRCIRKTDVYAALLVRILSDKADYYVAIGQTDQARTVAREIIAQAAKAHMDNHIHRAISILDA